MARRLLTQQSKHDSLVRRFASYYRALGYTVYADILGYVTPWLIYGRRPDVIAHKSRTIVVIEVETPETLTQHQMQIAAFRRYANNYINVHFWVRIAR